MLGLANCLAVFFILGRQHAAFAHGDHEYDHDRGHLNHDHRSHDDREGSLRRRLGISDSKYTIGGVAYESLEDFHQKGGMCHTQQRTPEEEAKADADFKAWKEAKDKQKKEGHSDGSGGRRLGGCGSLDCVNWNSQNVTVPIWFHIIRDGDTGKQYTYGSNPAYVHRSIKALNYGFQGVQDPDFDPYPSRSYNRYSLESANAKIQFCLAGTTDTDNASWYTGNQDSAMKSALKVGKAETLNVYVNLAQGYLGYAYYPSANSDNSISDGVVILNDSMPGGPLTQYNEGDTLTHEVGHYLNVAHTHDNGCRGVGDYMSPKSNERRASFGCPVGLDSCTGDGGKNPIHSFMSYVDDNCMDQFTPRQITRMQAAWETYRHKQGYSEKFTLDPTDKVSCIFTN